MNRYLQSILHPEFYQGENKKCEYFEGWYFKNECEDSVFSFIPGISRAKGDNHSFIQFIKYIDGKEHKTKYFRYPIGDFSASKDNLYINIAGNEFSSRGINASLFDEEDNIICKLNFGYLSKPQKSLYKPSVMGPFSYIPNMECNHGIISLSHKVNGQISDNGAIYKFDNGIGYIEKDWGSSFPGRYIWLQCGNFGQNQVDFMMAAAEVPIYSKIIIGLICILKINNKQEVFATYNGASISISGQSENFIELQIKKWNEVLYVKAKTTEDGELIAPSIGQMNRKIKESINSNLYLKYCKGNKLIYSGYGNHAGFERSKA